MVLTSAAHASLEIILALTTSGCVRVVATVGTIAEDGCCRFPIKTISRSESELTLKIIETAVAYYDRRIAERAVAILKQHGARFVDEAIRDNPDGPVVMVTTRYATEVDYQVLIGEADSGDRGKSRVIWDRSVTFGATDRTVAGGADFVAAARAQEEVQHAAYSLLNAPSEGSSDDNAE